MLKNGDEDDDAIDECGKLDRCINDKQRLVAEPSNTSTSMAVAKGSLGRYVVSARQKLSRVFSFECAVLERQQRSDGITRSDLDISFLLAASGHARTSRQP